MEPRRGDSFAGRWCKPLPMKKAANYGVNLCRKKCKIQLNPEGVKASIPECISFVIFHMVCLQELFVFVNNCLFAVMSLLVFDVFCGGV